MKKFYFLCSIVIASSFFLHMVVLKDNNIFFTVDQGYDAIYVREILTKGRFFLKGPETSIRGVFAGPLWYYFISLGFLLTGGHPAGGVMMLILLNLFLTFVLMLWIYKRVNLFASLLVGVSLQIFWPYFESSLWSFNPFPSVALTFFLIICLESALESKKSFYSISLVPIVLAFNADVASAAAMFIFYITFGLILLKKKIIDVKTYIFDSFLIPSVVTLAIARQFLRIFIQTKIISFEASGLGVFTGTNFKNMTSEFLKMIGANVPQNFIAGVFIFFTIAVIFLRQKKVNNSVRNFTLLSLLLFVTSFIFFGFNRGWRSWHTVFLPPVLFVSLLLMLTQISSRVSLIILTALLALQTINFIQRVENYTRQSENPSILYNELAAIDWVYLNSENQGFNVYNYTETFYDYPYQYLFWWYGLKKYGYLPGEYANFPLSHKELYVPGYESYLEPKRGSDRINFLIIQGGTNGEQNKDWIHKFRNYHELINTTNIGKIRLEKYYSKPNIPDNFCIWWNVCH